MNLQGAINLRPFDTGSFPPISVALAVSTRMECQLLAQFLQSPGPEFKIVGYAPDSIGIEGILQEQRADVAIVSPKLGDGPSKGFDLLRRVSELDSATRSIVLLDWPEPQLIMASFQAGAKGVFSRERAMESLPKCIRVVHSGQIWVSTLELQILLDLLNRHPHSKSISQTGMQNLTKREIDVAHLAAEGFQNQEIARKLEISAHTVKNYLYRVYEKLDLTNRTQLAAHFLSLPAAGPQIARPPIRRKVAS